MGEEKMSNNATSLQITEEKLEKLKKFYTASFAVWHSDEERRFGIEKKFREDLEKLKSKVILLGLNPSRIIPSHFCNFHDRSKTETFLRNHISKCKTLKGAYMTDISQTINGKSAEVIVSGKDIGTFKDQLEILGEKEYFVVCFGKKTFDNILKSQNPKWEKIETKSGKLGNYTLHCYKVLHYSAVIKYDADLDRFIYELETANDIISKHLR
jgi:hypothetical protein